MYRRDAYLVEARRCARRLATPFMYSHAITIAQQTHITRMILKRNQLELRGSNQLKVKSEKINHHRIINRLAFSVACCRCDKNNGTIVRTGLSIQYTRRLRWLFAKMTEGNEINSMVNGITMAAMHSMRTSLTIHNSTTNFDRELNHCQLFSVFCICVIDFKSFYTLRSGAHCIVLFIGEGKCLLMLFRYCLQLIESLRK